MKNKIYDVLLFMMAFIFAGAILYVVNIYKIKPNNVDTGKNNDAIAINVISQSSIINDVIKHIAGNKINVVSWENRKSINYIKDIQSKTKLFLLGEGVDGDIEEGSDLSNFDVVVLSNDVDISKLDYKIEIGKIDSKSPHYYWLSLHDIQNIVVAIARELGKLDAVNKESYINNAFSYLNILKDRQNKFEDSISSFKNKHVISLEHYFDELLDSLDMNVVGIFKLDGIDGEQMDELIYNIRYFGVREVIVPKGYKYADAIKDKIVKAGASLVEINVLPKDDFDNYLDFMRHNISAIVAGF